MFDLRVFALFLNILTLLTIVLLAFSHFYFKLKARRKTLQDISYDKKGVNGKNSFTFEFMPVFASKWQKLVYASQFMPRLKPVNTTWWH